MDNIKSNAIKKIEIASQYKSYIITAIILFASIYISYNFSHTKRISSLLLEMNKLSSYVNIDSKLNGEKERELRLCDFYIASAFRPYLGRNQLFEYCDLKITRQIIKSGARCMYIDIYNSNMGYDAEPVLSNGYKEGQWKLTFNTIRFDEFCQLLAYTIFSYGYVNNTNDPFILMLNLNTEGNVKCLNKIKKIIYERLGRYLLDNRYTYSSINIFNEPIKNFMKKIIIISSPGYKNSDLEELVNYTWEKDELKNITFEALDKNNMDPSVIRLNPYELKQFNKSNATMVSPNLETIYTKNYNPEIFWANGCQFVMMNYQKIDTHFDKYISFFRKDSFIDKPLSQRGTTNKKKPNLIKLDRSDGTNSDQNNPNNYQNESCPELPNENPIVGVDIITLKDNYSPYGLCFQSTNNNCDCDESQTDDCNFIGVGKIGDTSVSKKICCANKPIINAFDNLGFFSKSECGGTSTLELDLVDGKEKFDRGTNDNSKSLIYICDASTGLEGKNICLIDKNTGNSCPTGWDYTAKIKDNGKICCRNT